MKARYVLAGMALIAVAAVVAPAIGQENGTAHLSGSNKKANKALTKANKANKKANKALNKANSARQVANSKPDLSRIAEYSSGELTIGPGSVESAIAFCPEGKRVASGGGFLNTGGDGIAASEANSARTAWFIVGRNSATGLTGTIEALAYCSGAGDAVGSAKTPAASTVKSTEREVAKVVAELEAKIANRTP